MHSITPCLWFDGQAEQAAEFYTGIFPDARITKVTHFTEEGFEIHGRPAGSVMTVEFELNGQPFMGLDGGPAFRFNEAVSLVIPCEDQAEVDYYWEKLSVGGDPSAQQCGWLKDQFGLSWQVAPKRLDELLDSENPAVVQRVTAAFLQMQKIDITELNRVAEEAAQS